MFLVGGPPFSGTTLLALLLTQRNLLCLDEPDFHNPKQNHRGIPFLRKLFPEKSFPDNPEKSLTYEEATDLAEQCEKILKPLNLGIKTCNSPFIEHAKIFRARNYPVIAIIRDIRDALVSPLPEWLTEREANRNFLLIWNHLNVFDLWIRYEDLVTEPEKTIARLSPILATTLTVPEQWDSKIVPGPMLKLPRHQLLTSGTISKERVGIWRSSGKTFSDETHRTASQMGYSD